MSARIKSFSTLFVLICSGCSTIGTVPVPQASSENFLYVADLAHTLECELFDATELAAGIDDRYKDQEVLATLTLVVQSTSGVTTTPTVSFGVGTATLKVATATGPTGTGTRTMDVTLKYRTGQLKRCAPPPADRDVLDRDPIRLAGGLGLVEWVNTLARTAYALEADPESASYKVKFAIKNDSSATPSITTDGGDSVGVKLTANRSISHELAVTVKELKGGDERKKVVDQTLLLTHESFLDRSQ